MNAAAREAVRQIDAVELDAAHNSTIPKRKEWEGREPLELDFDLEPEPPRYAVDKTFERSTVSVVSGDTGAAKSIAAAALIVAALLGEEWLERAVHVRRPLVVDEENPARLVRARLRALGMTNEQRDGLRYFNRIGTRIGQGDWLEWLSFEAKAHGADLILIDTAMAATAAEVNDNDGVAALYGELRLLADELDAALVLLHHERKLQVGQTRDAGQAMMGARQWAGQADTHLALAVAGPLLEEPAESGHRRLRRPFTMRMPKARDGEPDIAETVAVTSEKDHSGRLLWLKVESEGPVEAPVDAAEEVAHRIGATLVENGDTRTGELAKLLGYATNDGTFTRACGKAEEMGLARKVKRGVWGPATAPEMFP